MTSRVFKFALARPLVAHCRASCVATELALVVNTPPAGGCVAVSPSVGTALYTPFTAEAQHWADDVEDLPLSFRFSFFYVDGRVSEEYVLTRPSDSSTAVGLILPQGLLQLVLFVADNRGAMTRSAVDCSGNATLVDVTPFTGSTSVAAVSAQSEALLDAPFHARDTQLLLNRVSAVSAELARHGDACRGVSCSGHGACLAGACVCDAGYSGTTCTVSSTPVDAFWGPFTEWSACDRSCGGGLQHRTRSCIPALYGGRDCVGSDSEARVCNADACTTEVDGGWSEWTGWSECSTARCDGHERTVRRTRRCDAPTPSSRGLPCAGAAEERRDCDEPCTWPVQRCPGSSAALALAPNPSLLPLVECSGHGACIRQPAACQQNEACLVVCDCEPFWDGADCGRNATTLASVRVVRETLLSTLLQTLTFADTDSDDSGVLRQFARTFAGSVVCLSCLIVLDAQRTLSTPAALSVRRSQTS